MAKPPLPIVEKPYYNIDGIVNNVANTDAYDVYYEPALSGKLVARRRPGLKLFCNLGTAYPGDGLFWWDKKGVLIAVSAGRVFKITNELGEFGELGGPAPSMLIGSPVTFADGQKTDNTPFLYMANGAQMVYTTGDSIAHPTDSGAPQQVSHVGYLNLRFLANEVNTSRFYFTDVNPVGGLMDPLYWSSPDNPLTTDSKGDNLTSLHVAWQEIVNWGQQGIEFWQDDGVTPFSAISSAVTEAGLLAPYSVKVCDNTTMALAMVDNKRAVIKLAGRAPQVVSEPIARILAEYSKVDDAVASVISAGGLAIYLLSFPTENVTWAYDLKNDLWVKWGKWRTDTATYDRFMGQHFVFAKAWGKYLIMSRIDGKIYEVDRSTYTDAGDIIRWMLQTAWVDHMSYRRKRSNQLFVKTKTGQGDVATPPVMEMYFRDDGRQEFNDNPAILQVLGPQGHNEFVKPLNRMGTYRSRQYQFVCTENIDIALVGAEEDVQELRN